MVMIFLAFPHQTLRPKITIYNKIQTYIIKLSELCELSVMGQQFDMKSPYFWAIHPRRPLSLSIYIAVD